MHQSSVERAKGRIVKQYAAAVTAGLVALTCGIASADAQDVMAKLAALEGEWIFPRNGTNTGGRGRRLPKHGHGFGGERVIDARRRP